MVLSKKIFNFLDLIRFNKPIGFLLLLWPCCFSLAILQQKQSDLMIWYIYFILGAFLMRSVGCIINDIIDINLDYKILRTAQRPLTTKKITIFEAIIFLFFLLFLSLLILIQFNKSAILLGFFSLPLIILYPYMKRYTYWPQLVLGLIFNWGVLIISYQFYDKITYDFLLLYIGCIFWTLAYDTIYAYQDKEDDIKINIKSTAILFGNKGHKIVLLFYTIFFLIIGFLGYKLSGSLLSLVVIFVFIFTMLVYLSKWRIDSKNSSNYYFKFNNIIGLFCFIFLIVF